MINVLEVSSQEELKRIMQDIEVDPYGIKIMLPKAMTRLIRIRALSNISANILKQEMLSLGGDAAISRSAITGGIKKTDCLLIGNVAQFGRLNEKLRRQPFGLDRLAGDLSRHIDNYHNDKFTLELGRFKIRLEKRACLMGILNLTPDSFSGDGFYRYGVRSSEYQTKDAVEYAQKMVSDGADIIDVGGESTRPGAKSVSVKEELARTIPVIKSLAKKIKVPISIDTRKPQVAEQALDSGASLVNDVSGLRSERMRKIVSAYKAAVVIMHMKGHPATMQKHLLYSSVLDDIIRYLRDQIDAATQSGIKKEKIIIDPGIGFGKTLEHNLQILKNLKEFKVLGRPIMVGTSRKSFLGRILNVPPKERLFATVASCVIAAKNGAGIIRAHDCLAVKQALRISEAINHA